MAIAEQFAGLQMDQLIGAPLRAAADASVQLAQSTADFINQVGFDNQGNLHTVAFGYERRSPNEDGTSSLDQMRVDIPLLAIVPIPNLQVDEVNILFDMEVKQSEREESSTDMSASVTGSLRIGPIRVSVTGSVSAHQNNTRSSDNSAKYHVDVRATNHGTPEGLARVLDMMAANVAPMLVGSSLKDGNGQELSDKDRSKAERRKSLRQEISQIENRLNAARDGLESSIAQMKKVASSQLNVYRETMTGLMNGENVSEEQQLTYSQTMDTINQCWSNFQNQVSDFVKMIADSGNAADGVSTMFALKAVNGQGQAAEYGNTETYYNAMASAQKSAVNSQNNVNKLEDELFNKKAEYNNVMAG